MHELSLAGGILRLVEDAAARERFTRVSALRLEAGALAGVEVRALRFAREALVPGTSQAGATIAIEEPPASAWCLRCACSIRIRTRTEGCPHCGGVQIQPTGGTELRVLDLQVHDD
jgi:hydrogenase nickel incorporation protein HypA/HybF